ncbi:MAG TPA: hypothetical protein VKZ75_07620 [Cyclobacteriaceae bacterium]|jgi:hypothetical protein|nr:hypothetical protein [Cyclobacteriaceae bacterium]
MALSAPTMSKEDELLKTVVETWAPRNGYTEVRANLEGYELPAALSNKESEDRIQPDIMAVKRGARWYIEIVRKDTDVEKTVSKWKLLSVLGANKGGGLVLIAPSGTVAFAERMLKKYDIQAQVVKF